MVLLETSMRIRLPTPTKIGLEYQSALLKEWKLSGIHIRLKLNHMIPSQKWHLRCLILTQFWLISVATCGLTLVWDTSHKRMSKAKLEVQLCLTKLIQLILKMLKEILEWLSVCSLILLKSFLFQDSKEICLIQQLWETLESQLVSVCKLWEALRKACQEWQLTKKNYQTSWVNTTNFLPSQCKQWCVSMTSQIPTRNWRNSQEEKPH